MDGGMEINLYEALKGSFHATLHATVGRIENILKEVIFLNVDKLPGTELNKISAMLAIKLVGYCYYKLLKERYCSRGYSRNF
jgi:hypothetical protein